MSKRPSPTERSNPLALSHGEYAEVGRLGQSARERRNPIHGCLVWSEAGECLRYRTWRTESKCKSRLWDQDPQGFGNAGRMGS